MFFLPHKKVYPQGTGMLLPGHCPTLYCRLTIISAGFPSRPPSLLASTESHLVKSSATQSSYWVTPIHCLSILLNGHDHPKLFCSLRPCRMTLAHYRGCNCLLVQRESGFDSRRCVPGKLGGWGQGEAVSVALELLVASLWTKLNPTIQRDRMWPERRK